MKKHKHQWVRVEGGGFKCRVPNCTATKPSRLQVLTDLAKWLIIVKLKQKSPQMLRQLQDPVIEKLGEKTNREGETVHRYEPVHTLAFIRAYKELEAQKLIKISRPADIPFPATDNRTEFALGSA